MHGERVRQWAVLLIVCAVASLILTDFSALQKVALKAGDVAERDVRAPFDFAVEDPEATAVRREQGAADVVPVYEHDTTLGTRLQARIATAFETARGRDGSPSQRASEFQSMLGLAIDPRELDFIVASGFDPRVAEVTNELLGQAMRRFVVTDGGDLPSQGGPINVVHRSESGADEERVELDRVLTVEQARQSVTLYALEHFPADAAGDDGRLRAAIAIARAGVRANLSFDASQTDQRRQAAREAVPAVVISVAKGAIVVRDGEVVSAQQEEMLAAMTRERGTRGPATQAGSLFLFCLLTFGTVYRFSRAYVRKFAQRTRDLEAVALLLVLTLLMAKGAVGLSHAVGQTFGSVISETALWFAVPVAGAALLVRILVNSETSLVFAVVASTLCGLIMEQDALMTAYFVVSSVAAAGAVHKKRERKAILRAGLVTGLMNAAFAVLIGLVQANLSPGAGATPLGDAAFAFGGGLLSAFLVLGLVPFFEMVGFVTDLQLLELANPDHPLLRNLMLRAPGSYHHSVMVGALAEACAEAVGANALMARVCAYFHDIGKAVRPVYFVENQRDGVNRHDRLSPQQSARVIIDHVRDGLAIAREHGLPQPIIDNIAMHHGTGLVHYFYAKAREQNPHVDPADFRYPGPRPNTREAGIIMLADKVEAASRTLRETTPETVAATVQKIVNSVMSEGQLDECPLTVSELVIIADTLKKTVLAIHHHRIEYPPAPSLAPRAPGEPPPKDAVITLELAGIEAPAVARHADGLTDETPMPGPVDYESTEYLPTSTEPRDGRGK